VTRARYNIKLVSSIMPEDIDLTRTQSLGAKLLREYMLYARDGVTSLASMGRGDPSGRPGLTQGQPLEVPVAEAPFEDAVYAALTAQGLTLHRHVGASNYRIDLGVVDPKQSNRYLLGIECDGAMYQLAPTARERDRLRQQVLEQLGWKLHRIWSHDWISNPTAEIDKVMARLNEAPPASLPATETSLAAEPTKTAEIYLAPAEMPEEVKSLPTYVWPYLYAKLPQYSTPLGSAVPHDLVDDVVKVVGTEGPVHIDLVYARIGAAYKAARLTAKVKQLMGTAIGIAVHDRRIEQRGDFLWPIGLATPIVRAPKDGDEVRPIDRIAPEEIAEAAFLCVQEARSLAEADVITQTAKLLGYARVTKKIDAAVTQALETLKSGGRIDEEGAVLRARAN
jgi:very-short-patch-repair endonuclease